MATVEDILLPDIGDFSDVEVIEILVAPGDRIEAEQSILSLESDKATIEIPSPLAGVILELKIKIGDRVSRGDLLMTLETEGMQSGEAQTGEAPAVSGAARAASGAAVPAATTTQSPKAPPPRPASAGQTISVVLPDIGDFADIPVVEVLIAPGDRIEVDQSLLTLESEKATMEIPSPNAGIVEELAVKVGDNLNQGDLILTLRTDTEADRGEPSATSEPMAASTAEELEAPPGPASIAKRAPGESERRPAPVLPRPEDMAAIAKGRKAHASPAVRRFARELGVDLTFVKGSGPKGRVLKDDVQGFVKQALAQGAPTAAGAALPFALPAAPEIDFAKFGPVEVAELSRIKKLSGRHLHRCWLSVPHVTQFDEADITSLEAFRNAQKATAAEKGIKLTFVPFLLKAVATALSRMPILKASLTADGEGLVLKHFTHIGVAVDTPQGLVVPVVRDVDKKGIYALAAELSELGEKARTGKLLPGDMQGGCFTISSLGGIGGTAFTPIVNSPEVAILGVSRAATKPFWNGQTFEPRLMLPLSLSYDHRVVDGADGARFTSLLGDLLGDLRQVLL
ncbi:dihydrolipoyllysine-residue acetyltransferase [Thiocapsa roseopersicina]|uniref:Acetyltransferase component of pyruvate dehydrogenase complex n=1 Tax=Thiocapsa roseopersicina TaxID=1058 RepID=A0A1H2VV87_THIRO|nr:dihydrolipoyllysine-residue acetyltransferase [Thiocapsa roseopersicina]SDW71789.1 pyruvate dehydrogenase E2 component (dihydrolipoamide acetyltransferase) [Thiocapsa roseopersicina]